MAYRIISTDSHVNEPMDLWQKRLPAHLRANGYKVVDAPDGGQGWTAEGDKPFVFGLGAVAQAAADFNKFKARGVRFEDLPPGNYDPVEHLKDQDKDGVDASVMYPGMGMKLPQIRDRELRLASYRVYNDWMSDEFAATDPKRILPLAMIPVDDGVDVAVGELQHAIRKGHRGGIISTYPVKPYSDRHYDALWQAAADSGFPLHFHRGIGRNVPAVMGVNPSDGTSVASIVLRFFAAMEPICLMTFAGVFHRHPGLKVVSAESDFGWWAFFSQACDEQWERQRHWSKMDLTEKPSEYFKRQLFLTFMYDTVGCSTLKFIGTDNFMFASDYPHSVSTWPESRKYIDRQMVGLSDTDKNKLMAGNAMRLYQLS